jgi:hypothetical protein
MSDMGEAFREWTERKRKHREKMLAQANPEGWTQHTPYHWSRTIGGVRIEWWPSGGKAKVGDRMVYGHRKVAAAIDKMLRQSEDQGASL